MSYADLDAGRWRRLDGLAARRLAAEIGQVADAELVSVRPCQRTGATGWVALYRRDDAVYAFVPGGAVQVGFDAAHFAPTSLQVADYAKWPVGGPDIHAFVDSMTSPRRTAHLPALLVSVKAVEAGSRPADLDDPRVGGAHEYLKAGWEHDQPAKVVFNEDWGRVEVMVDERCQVTSAVLVEYMTREELTAGLTGRGLRLPTPDEWEHACGAGVASLFRWGDHHPIDRYPTDYDDGPHRLTNVFGLHIGQDPYRPEQTSDPRVCCGGDGGRAACGDYGYFTGWLPLAISYRDRPYDSADEHDEPEDGDDPPRSAMVIRPVIQLS